MDGWEPFILVPGLASGAILVSGRVCFRFEMSLKQCFFRSFGFFFKLVSNDVESDIVKKNRIHQPQSRTSWCFFATHLKNIRSFPEVGVKIKNL